jgi:hypothetical protein
MTRRDCNAKARQNSQDRLDTGWSSLDRDETFCDMLRFPKFGKWIYFARMLARRVPDSAFEGLPCIQDRWPYRCSMV